MISRPAFGRLFALLFVVLLAVPAPTLATAGTHDAEASHADDVQFARTMEEMRGHLAVSLEYKRANESERAAEHAHHPAEEYWDVVSTDIRAANETVAEDLHQTLLAAPDHARNDSADEYAAFLHDDLFPLFDRATTAVVGETNATFSTRVSLGLLQRATDEYGEGVAANGTVVEREEYDDARAFVARADAVYNESVRPTLSDHAREEIDSAFADATAAIADTAAPDDLDSSMDYLESELTAYTDVSSSDGGSAAAIDRIETDLHEAVEQYENGHPDEAKATIRQTYLSNFEGVEGTLIEEDPQLVGDLEAAFNDDLPGLIDDDASVSTVRERVETMETKLARAETILESQGTTEITLGDGETTTTTAPTTAPESTTSTAVPGFSVVIGLLALVAAALLARRGR